jgi:hypothetical protein
MDIEYRARIRKTVVYFSLADLVSTKPRFSIRELVWPWLRAGNKPDVYININDKNNNKIFTGDRVMFELVNSEDRNMYTDIVFYRQSRAQFSIGMYSLSEVYWSNLRIVEE